MSYFESNIHAFRARYPEHSSSIETCLLKADETQSAPLASTKHLKPDVLTSSKIAVFSGLGDAWFPTKVLESIKKQKLFLVIIEKSWVALLTVFHKMDLANFIADPRVHFFVDIPEDEIEYYFWNFFSTEDRIMSSGAVCYYPVTQDDHYYAQAHETFMKVAKARLDYISAPPEDAYRGLLNVLKNLPRIPSIPVFDKLQGVAKGLPGLVVSTGPSLDQSIALLREHKDQFVIFCVDSALKILLENGITPHFVACLERVQETVHFFTGMPALKDTWLVANPLIAPETFENFNGPKAHLLREGAALSWFVPDGKPYDLGGSASHMAYWGLHMLGCDPIILLGQDLAFDRASGRTHVTGAADDVVSLYSNKLKEIKSEAKQDDHWTEGNNGEPILSWNILVHYRHIFRRLIYDSKKTCINAIVKEYGAKIPGTQRMDPKDAFEKFGRNIDVRSAIHAKLAMSPAEIETHQDKLNERVAFAKKELSTHIIPKTLEILDDLSIFYQHHLPSFFKPEWQEAYGRLFHEIQLKDREISGEARGVYHALIAPFTATLKINNSLEILRLNGNPDPYSKKVQFICPLLQHYYREVLAWSVRVLNLLESH